MRHAPVNKLKLFKVTFLLSINYFLCNLNKKTLITVVLLLDPKSRFWSVNCTCFSGPTLKRFWRYLRLFVYYLLSKWYCLWFVDSICIWLNCWIDCWIPFQKKDAFVRINSWIYIEICDREVCDSIDIKFRTSHQRCSMEKLFLEISQNSQENTCARVPSA